MEQIINKYVFSTELEQKYFNAFSDYRKKYAKALLNVMDTGKSQDVNQSIKSLNIKFHKKLLGIDKRNNLTYLHGVLLILLNNESFDEEDKEYLECDPLFGCLMGMGQKNNIIPYRQLKDIIDLKDLIGILTSEYSGD